MDFVTHVYSFVVDGFINAPKAGLRRNIKDTAETTHVRGYIRLVDREPKRHFRVLMQADSLELLSNFYEGLTTSFDEISEAMPTSASLQSDKFRILKSVKDNASIGQKKAESSGDEASESIKSDSDFKVPRQMKLFTRETAPKTLPSLLPGI